MKTLIVGLMTAFLSLGAFANEQTAEELYKARGENVQNAFKSYEKYMDLAKAEPNQDLQAEKFWLASQSVYYVGTTAEDNSTKKTHFQLGYEAASKGIQILEPKWDTLSNAQKETLANAYFWYGANLGKWGEANGVASSLGRWPELKQNMENILDLDMASVQDFGANRVLGRAYFKLPFPLGSKKKSVEFLREAFENTLNGHDVSTNGLNNIYYAQALYATGDAETAKTILKSFLSKDAKTFNPNRVPETLVEQVEAKELLELW